MDKTTIFNEMEISLITINEQKQKSIDNIYDILEKIEDIGKRHNVTYRFRLKSIENDDEYLYAGIGLSGIYTTTCYYNFNPFYAGNSIKVTWQNKSFNFINELEKNLVQVLPNVLKELNAYIKKT